MFDMLLESGRRSSLLPGWGKGVALTLHVLVLGALWRSPGTTHAQPVVIQDDTDVYRPAEDPPIKLTVPVAPNVDESIIPVPLIDPGIPVNLTPSIPIPGRPTTNEPIGLPSTGSDPIPAPLVQEPPELLTAPMPDYPALLRNAGVQGRVIVSAVVDTLGRAESGSVRIVLSDNPGFDASALATVRAARFRPARMYGRAVRVLVQLPVVFRLN